MPLESGTDICIRNAHKHTLCAAKDIFMATGRVATVFCNKFQAMSFFQKQGVICVRQLCVR